MIRVVSTLPNTSDFDFLTLKERQNSEQYSTHIEISFCIAPLVGAKRQRSSAYIMHVKAASQIRNHRPCPFVFCFLFHIFLISLFFPFFFSLSLLLHAFSDAEYCVVSFPNRVFMIAQRQARIMKNNKHRTIRLSQLNLNNVRNTSFVLTAPRARQF